MNLSYKKILAVSLFLSLSTLVKADPLPSVPHVYVEGSAEIEVAPDTVEITVGIESVNKDINVAKTTLDEKSTRLLKAVLANKVEPSDVSADSIRVSRQTEWENGKNVYVGTRVSQKVKVKVTDIENFDAVLAALISAKVSEDMSSVMSVSDEDKYTDEALSKAMDDASKRAKMLAQSQGKDIKGVHSISEFNLRLIERQYLNVSREITGSFSSVGVRQDADGMMAESVGRASGKSVFEPGTMVARAQVFVVYTIK